MLDRGGNASMNQALQNLKFSNPELLQAFLTAIAKDLGISQSISTFHCPNCHAVYEIIARSNTGQAPAVRKLGPGTAMRRKTTGGEVNPLLIEVARRKKTTTGTINAEFKTAMGAAKLKNMSKKEFRVQKIEWLKTQLAKNKKRS